MVTTITYDRVGFYVTWFTLPSVARAERLTRSRGSSGRPHDIGQEQAPASALALLDA